MWTEGFSVFVIWMYSECAKSVQFMNEKCRRVLGLGGMYEE